MLKAKPEGQSVLKGGEAAVLTSEARRAERADMLIPLRLSCFQQCFDAVVGFLLFQEFEERLFLQL